MDLVVLDMFDYEVILGMDWLSKYYARIYCKKKIVIFRPPGEEEKDSGYICNESEKVTG